MLDYICTMADLYQYLLLKLNYTFQADPKMATAKNASAHTAACSFDPLSPQKRAIVDACHLQDFVAVDGKACRRVEFEINSKAGAIDS